MPEIRMPIGGTTPPAPPVNQVSFYAKADKRFYMQDDSGAEVKILTNETTLSSLTVQAPLLTTGTSTPTLSIANVTTTVNGAMIAADKIKLNNATNNNTANTLVSRDSLGNFSANEITATTFNGIATNVSTIPVLTGAITSTGTSNLTTLGTGVINNVNISNTAAIAMSKLAVNPTLRANHTGVQDANTLINLDVEVEAYLLNAAPITDDMISSTADISLSKLAVNPLSRANHTGSQTASTISDFGVEVNFAIGDYLVSNPITNNNISTTAGIALSKLATNPLVRSNHTGTQLASTISDFAGGVLSAVSAGDGITISPIGEFDVVGTANRISVSTSGVDIASTYAGQTTITTVGTITSGTWNGAPVLTNYGGTGASTPGAGANKLTAINNITGSVSLNSNDRIALVNASGGVRTITLPSAANTYQYVIKKIDSSANNVIINAAGGNLIEGVSSKTLTTQYDYITLISDGATNWYIIS
jgi:hypothetical protein